MTTIEEIISKPFLEVNGTGKIIFDDELQTDGSFIITLYANGTVQGFLELQSVDTAVYKKVHNSPVFFSIKGITSADIPILVEKCSLLGVETIFNTASLKINFRPTTVISNPNMEETKPSKGLSIRFTLLNMFETLGVSVDTSMGTLTLSNFENSKELENLMDLYKLSLITAVGDLDVKPNGSNTLKELVENASEIMRDFLRITSLAQSVLHSYVMISVYEKISETKASLIYYKLLWVKKNPPIKWGIVGPAYSSIFLKNAWSGYSKELHKKFGFDIALEWYVDSWTSGNVLESKYMSATTCLEMLMDKFHTQNNSEFLLNDSNFESILEKIKILLKEELTSIDVDGPNRAIFYNNLKGLNRRSYADKAIMLLDYWKIKNDDVGTTIQKIVSIRNKITHSGTYHEEGESDFTEIKNAFIGLEVLLTRIFLAMLNYHGLYFDWVAGKNVDFDTVRISV